MPFDSSSRSFDALQTPAEDAAGAKSRAGTVITPPPFQRSRSASDLARKIFADKKFRELASYIFWGAATTFVSFLTYGIATRALGMSVVPATVVSWVFAVLFAFVTNKLWVFGSKSLAPALVLRELVAFVTSRLTSGGIEIFMMWFFVDVLGVNDWLMKVVAGIVVIVANYVFSKIFVFRKK